MGGGGVCVVRWGELGTGDWAPEGGGEVRVVDAWIADRERWERWGLWLVAACRAVEI